MLAGVPIACQACLRESQAAYGIAKALPINPDAVVGMTLAAIGAASAAGLKASQLARRADLALAVSIVVVLPLVNLVAVPLWAGAVVSGASISAGSILGDLLLLVLAPLAIGLVTGGRYTERAKNWPAELGKVSNLALALAVVAGISVNWHAIVSLIGSWVLLASVLTAIVGAGLGALVGRSDPATRNTTGLVSGLRFGSLGLIVIGTQLNGNSAYLGPALVFSLIDLIVILFVAVEIGRHTTVSAGSRPAKPQHPAADETQSEHPYDVGLDALPTAGGVRRRDGPRRCRGGPAWRRGTSAAN